MVIFAVGIVTRDTIEPFTDVHWRSATNFAAFAHVTAKSQQTSTFAAALDCVTSCSARCSGCGRRRVSCGRKGSRTWSVEGGMKLALVFLSSLVATSAFAETDLRRQWLADRAYVKKLPAMTNAYIDPCAPDPEGTDPTTELARYRNLLDCRSLKVDDVDDADLARAYERAMRRSDKAEAQRVARRLQGAVLAVRIDRAFVKKRRAELAALIADRRIDAAARPKLAAMLADADTALAAARIGAANMVLNYLVVETMNHLAP